MNLFRIVDFFELLQTLRTGKLRVPSAARFSDPNELIGSLFSTLANPRFSPLTEDALQQRVRDQTVLRESQYISCWTRMQDSVAMWEIYSPNRTAAQMEVPEDAIKKAFQAIFESSPFAKGHGKPANHDETYFYPPVIGKCEYANLLRLAEELKEKTRENQSRAIVVLDGEGMDAFAKVYSDICDQAGNNSQNLFFVKDHAYAHESEVRFCIQAMRRDGKDYEDCKNDKMFILYDTYLRASNVKESGENIFIDFPAGSIQHVWLDGRAPDWLADVQQGLLKDLGIDSARSNAYGAFTERHLIEKWWD